MIMRHSSSLHKSVEFSRSVSSLLLLWLNWDKLILLFHFVRAIGNLIRLVKFYLFIILINWYITLLLIHYIIIPYSIIFI